MAKPLKPRTRILPDFPIFFGKIVRDDRFQLIAAGVKIIPARWSRHAPFLFQLFDSSLPETPQDLPPGHASRQAWLTNQFTKTHIQHITVYGQAAFAVIMKDKCPIGRLTVLRDKQAIHLVELTILPSYQDLGIAPLILSLLQDEATKTNLALVQTPLST